MPELDCEISRDGLLGGRVTILQPAGGYRTAIDPVLLAAAVPAQPGETVLDAASALSALTPTRASLDWPETAPRKAACPNRSASSKAICCRRHRTWWLAVSIM